MAISLRLLSTLHLIVEILLPNYSQKFTHHHEHPTRSSILNGVTRIIGRWPNVVKGLLGEGGKKRVYLAHDTTLDRDVAFGLIKAEGLDVAARQRITREAQAMARLGDHPNLMPIFDLGEENGQPYMVQPLMSGGDIEALIDGVEDGRLPLEDALRIASEILSGLEFAHGKGIIHRDLKPGNVWLTDPSTGSGQATVRIGDFGLALSLDHSRLTQEKMMVGTVSYMPPEQATGGEVTAQSDSIHSEQCSTKW